jgi:tRNA threonylcarbamoyladenosine modification (KEOPS) complex  Pcc1 subunit
MASVTLSFKVFLPSRQAEIMYRSMEPEVRTMVGRRTKASLATHSDGIVFDLHSADLTSARAAANTLIRLAEASIRTLEVLGDVR